MTAITTARCSPVQMRQALELVDMMRKAGMEFVPVPVLNPADRERLMIIMADRLTKIEAAIEGVKA